MRRVSRAAEHRTPCSAPGAQGSGYLPRNGNLGFRVLRYDLELNTRVSGNRLDGTATLTAASYRELRRFTDPQPAMLLR